MKIIITFMIISVLVLCSCRKEKKKSSFETEKLIQGAKKNKIVIQEESVEKKKKIEKKELLKKEKKQKVKDSGFFNGRFKQINGQQYGIYSVQKGDNVWIIAKRYLREYLKKDNYSKTDVGNIAFRINKANYSQLLGGVNDDLEIGDKILIPID